MGTGWRGAPGRSSPGSRPRVAQCTCPVLDGPSVQFCCKKELLGPGKDLRGATAPERPPDAVERLVVGALAAVALRDQEILGALADVGDLPAGQVDVRVELVAVAELAAALLEVGLGVDLGMVAAAPAERHQPEGG